MSSPNHSKDFPTVIYIAGANRSGTTLLEILLAQHAAVVSGGELFYVLKRLQDSTTRCTCGESVSTCSFWWDIAARLNDLARQQGASLSELTAEARNLESRSALDAYSNGRGPEGMKLDHYAAIQCVLMEAVCRTKPGASFIVDSSKSEDAAAARPVILGRHLGFDIRVVHLVRSPEGVVASILKGTNREYYRGVRSKKRLRGPRALITWLRANIAVGKIARQIGEDRVIRLRFEDLVARPGETLAKLGAFLGLDVQSIVAATEANEIEPVPHMITGNRMRLEPITLDPQKAETDLPWYYRAPCALAGWVALRR